MNPGSTGAGLVLLAGEGDVEKVTEYHEKKSHRLKVGMTSQEGADSKT